MSNNFYVLEPIYADPIEITEINYKHKKCSICGTRPAGRVGSVSIKFNSQEGLLDFTWGAGIFVNQKVIDVLNEYKLTGWRKGHVQVDTKSILLKNYVPFSELVIIGQTQNYAQIAGLQILRSCEVCRYYKYAYPEKGLEIPLECWDGNDIFYIFELPGIPIVSEDFKSMLKQENFTGFDLIPVADWYPPY